MGGRDEETGERGTEGERGWRLWKVEGTESEEASGQVERHRVPCGPPRQQDPLTHKDPAPHLDSGLVAILQVISLLPWPFVATGGPLPSQDLGTLTAPG